MKRYKNSNNVFAPGSRGMRGIRGTRSRIPKRTCAAGELKTQLQRRSARALTLRTWNDFG